MWLGLLHLHRWWCYGQTLDSYLKYINFVNSSSSLSHCHLCSGLLLKRIPATSALQSCLGFSPLQQKLAATMVACTVLHLIDGEEPYKSVKLCQEWTKDNSGHCWMRQVRRQGQKAWMWKFVLLNGLQLKWQIATQWGRNCNHLVKGTESTNHPAEKFIKGSKCFDSPSFTHLWHT